MPKYDTLDAFMNAVLLDCYGHCRTEADIRISCGSPSASGGGSTSYSRAVVYSVNGREDCRAQERISLDTGDSVAEHEREMRDSLENMLARRGLPTERKDDAIVIDTQSLHRAQYATGEVADMLGVSVDKVVDAYRKSHSGREPQGRAVFAMHSVVDLGVAMGMFPGDVAQRIGAYHAGRPPVRKAV